MSYPAGTIVPVEISISSPSGAPLTGLTTLTVSILDVTPGGAAEGYEYDFSTSAFVASGAVDQDGNLIARANRPGTYYLAGGFNTTGRAGRSFAFLFPRPVAVDTTSVPAVGTIDVVAAGSAATAADVTAARDAVIARGDTAWITATGFATPANVTTSQGVITTAIAGIASTLSAGVTVAAIAADAITGTSIATSAVTKIQSGLAVAGGAMTLAAGALTSTAIGSGFVAAVQSGLSTLTAAGVWAVTDGAFTKGAALDLLRRRQTNADSMSPTGLVSHKADDGTTEKTSQVRDADGNPYVPPAGSAVSRGAET